MYTFGHQGGLLFEKMKLSEHLSIEKTATLQGFVYLRPFTLAETTYISCDHAMVVMFVPFTANFSEIIVVFAAHGNVKTVQQQIDPWRIDEMEKSRLMEYDSTSDD